jgi:hypothetical protein
MYEPIPVPGFVSRSSDRERCDRENMDDVEKRAVFCPSEATGEGNAHELKAGVSVIYE